MCITTINAGKELAAAYRPVLLATFTFGDGSVLRVSTHNGQTSGGGYDYSGNAYLPRIDDQEIDRLAQLSEQGVDRIPSATVRLADPDGWLWTNYERASGKGFKGASLELRLVLHDVTTGDYSSDSLVPFVGICNQPEVDEKNLTVSAAAKMNLSRFSLPSVPIQPRCPWVNPITAAQRAEADNPDSPFYFCGETNNAATPCSYTKATCTRPNRYGGVTWDPDKTGSGREYISGSKVSWRNADTSARYRECFPLFLGGLAWIDAPVLNVVGDGNYTRGEAAIGVGEVDVQRVIANGVELTYAPGMTGDFRWHYVNTGVRDGTPNPDRPYNGGGDPYGNITAIQFLATRSVIDPSSVPSIRVLARRKKVREYRRIVSITGGVVTLDGANEDCAGNPPFTVTIVGNSGVNGTFELTSWTWGPPGTVTLSGSSGSGTGGYLYYENSGVISGGSSAAQGASTPWALLEALRWSRFSYADIDALSFSDAAAKVCNPLITVTDAGGNSLSQPRFSTSMALRQRRSTAEIVRGLRQSIGAQLVPDSAGKIKLLIEGPLAEQQPAPVDGSNYDTPVASNTRSGSAANGYVAYRFTEANSWELRRVGRDPSEMPNRVAFGFQDPAQGYAISSFSLTDSDDVARVKQEFPGGLQVEPEGISSHNHALRAAKLGLYKLHRGNSQGDTRGTDWFEWKTSFRGCKLAIGQIVALNSTRLALTNQLVRITGIKPSRNYETVTLAGHFHSDDWYLDSVGNVNDPAAGARAGREPRPAFPWMPYKEQPAATDPMFPATEWTFGLQQAYEVKADGTKRATVQISGRLPVTEFSTLAPPLIGTLGTTAASGGTIPGSATYYAAVCARDSAGKLSMPSIGICRIDVTAVTDLNTITIPVVTWDSATSGYEIFAGPTPVALTWQATGSGKPASVTLTALDAQSWGLPDTCVVVLRAKAKRVIHSGPVGAVVDSVVTGKITCGGIIDPGDDWNGRDVSVIADASDGSASVWNFHVTAYDVAAGEFTCTPDPAAAGVESGDVLIIRPLPDTHTATTIGDSKFVNMAAPSGLSVDGEKGNLVRIISGAGRGQVRRIASNTATVLTVDTPFDVVPDATSRFIVEAPTWEYVADSMLAPNGDPAAETTISLPIDNLPEKPLLVMVVTVDSNERESAEQLAPCREIWLFGQDAAFVTADGYHVIPYAATITPDLGNGRNQEVTLTGNVTVAAPITAPVPGDWLQLKIVQDSTGGRTVTWNAVFDVPDGFDPDVRPSKSSIYQFTFNAGSVWELSSAVIARG